MSNVTRSQTWTAMESLDVVHHPSSSSIGPSRRLHRLNSSGGSQRHLQPSQQPSSSNTSTVMKSPGSSKPRASATSLRLYRAPQASIRAGSNSTAAAVAVASAAVLAEDKTGNTRRRRRASEQYSQANNGHSASTPDKLTGYVDRSSLVNSEREGPPGSAPNTSLEALEAPMLWSEPEESLLSPSLHRSKNNNKFSHGPANGDSEIQWLRTPPGHNSRRASHRLLQVEAGYDDVSETIMEDESLRTYQSHEPLPDGAGKWRRTTPWQRMLGSYPHVLQLLVIMVLGVMIYDAHHRVAKHKVQIQQYDEERAHILEQMMWIDQAAKKVHKNYAQKDVLADLNTESKDELRQEAKKLGAMLERIQLRIQLNDRERIVDQFGERPVQVSLKLTAHGSSKHLVIALSDDTPHAASILLQQIAKEAWDDIRFEKLPEGSIQASSNLPSISPLLEFIEPSRGCHEGGSVSLHLVEEGELRNLVLRIHLRDNESLGEDAVCIGRVVEGLEDLLALPSVDSNHSN